MTYTNELIHETSPYLLQHAHNPVHWYPWGDKAFSKAVKENKLVIVSIGYAACHWCHVMEHESFENEQVAAYMNKHFVCIKVDREERPDVDMIYMNASQLINGSGGWPLNALALPDGKPFFAATYFPPDRWMKLLQYFVNEDKTNRAALEEQAEELSKGIAEIDLVPMNTQHGAFTRTDVHQIYNILTQRVDMQFGGLATTVKFPMPSVWEWLLEYHSINPEREALKILTQTLNRMKDGGIYDQIGGGFARYATDRKWHVPHFEKMLYDNGQMISLYSHAYQVTKDPAYKQVVYETIHFLKEELYDGTCFYASLDADSEKEEGKYYVWYIEEIREILGEDADGFCKYYGFTPQGNWEDGKNIPDISYGKMSSSLTGEPSTEQLLKWKKKLEAIRQKRVKPALDNKVITAWNAMTCSALILAWRAFNDKEFLIMAERNILFTLENLWDSDAKILYRNFQNGKQATYGFLDDYAFLISALTELYQSTFEFKYLRSAKELNDVVIQNFSDSSNGMFFYNDERFHQLITRPVETEDGVIPSSNSLMAENLFVLGTLFDNRDFIEQSLTMVKNVKTSVLTHPEYKAHWAKVMNRHVYNPFEVAITGSDFQKILMKMQQPYQPHVVYCGTESDENLPLLENKFRPDKTIVYVCRNKTCNQPVTTANEALEQMKNI